MLEQPSFKFVFFETCCNNCLIMLLNERTRPAHDIKLLSKMDCWVTAEGMGVKIVFLHQSVLLKRRLVSGWGKSSINSHIEMDETLKRIQS